jgi:rhamnulokinase/L-fuculokinase
MNQNQVLAFDLGASNGRAIVAQYDEGKIELHEVHRFSNDPVELNQYLYWDFPRLFHELKTALLAAKNQGFHLQSLGIDSWGVDYGLLDEAGELIANPIHYRDKRAARGMEMLLEKFNKDELKQFTGMDCVSYNTINQLMNDRQVAKNMPLKLLNIPDLFNYFLTGSLSSEYSMVTTTQLYNYETKDWNYKLMKELSIPAELFSPVMTSGSLIGDLKPSICEELNMKPLKIVSVTSHDTAAAIRAIPSNEEDFLFIATGTWIIVGSKQKQMTMNDHVMKYNLTNEGGKYTNVNLMKNHVGLWILQESKRQWHREGMTVDFAEMVSLGIEADIDAFIDIMDSRFFEPGNMPLKVVDYCKESGQRVPTTIGEIVRVIEQSLAKQIAQTLLELEEAVGKTYEQVHIIGGGIQDALLCNLIESYSGKKLVVGPKEATTLGNVIDQFVALDIIKESERIEVLKKSI